MCRLVIGRITFRESLQDSGRAVKLAIPGPDCSNLDKSRAFRSSLPGTGAATRGCQIVQLDGWKRCAYRYRAISKQQEDGREADL